MNTRMCGHWYQSEARFGPMVHASLGIGEENSGKLVTNVRHASHELAKAKNLNFVLVDGSPGIGCPVIASLTNADVALVVAEPTVSAISDLKRVCELTGYFKIPTLILINKADINPDCVQEITAFAAEKHFELVGELPYDSGFTKAQLQEKTVVEYDPDGLGQRVRSVWTKIESWL